MVGYEVASFATVHFLIPVVSGVVYLVTLLRSKDCTFFLFFFLLRIMKHTVTPYNVYNVLWDVGAVSDS